MQFKRIKRHIDGVLLLDKPLGFSSNQALQKVKWLFQAAKAGHTGSLDPLATGVLPICFGEATKFSHFLLDSDKSYRALVKFGSTTTTGDAEGEVLTTAAVNVSPHQLQDALNKFRGEISQVPPMYSALKHQGKALYEYARQGVDIDRLARAVNIYDITLNQFDGQQAEITVVCSKGTYIRSLAHDFGKAVNSGAYLSALCRTKIGAYDLKDALSIDDMILRIEAAPAPVIEQQ